jgi:hypothetical protein
MTHPDQRPDQEQARLALAIRMLGHEARTHLITACTGFSQDRIRKLWDKRFRRVNPRGPGGRRHRGKSPSSIEFFVRNPWIQADASLLAHLFANWGLLQILPDLSTPAVPLADPVLRGQRFCDAFEEFQSINAASPVTFEHAWNLLDALTARGELLLLDCGDCHALYIQDALALDGRRCPACRVIPACRRGRRG